ncbi:hypothetical protein B0H14DRAFT_2562433 [Mycena olivaceomarginata]|nr:hypothetical protein B0H14DRAFT_2562433 [Mycena olivaceomarginata]
MIGAIVRTFVLSGLGPAWASATRFEHQQSTIPLAAKFGSMPAYGSGQVSEIMMYMFKPWSKSKRVFQDHKTCMWSCEKTLTVHTSKIIRLLATLPEMPSMQRKIHSLLGSQLGTTFTHSTIKPGEEILPGYLLEKRVLIREIAL